MTIQTNHFYVLTGAMGAGKSTVLAELRKQGMHCVDEPARQILAEQRAINGLGIPGQDNSLFTQLLLSRAINQYLLHQSHSQPVIFDRGIPDNISYANLFDLPTEIYVNAANHFRYQPSVFFLPGWEAIYQTDDERKMPYEQAKAFGQHLKKIYESLQYKVIDVPLESPRRRAEWIRQHII